MGRVSPRPLRVLLTATGAPGAARLIRALRENGERELAVIGTDMSARSGGRFLCDAFHVVPPGASDEFAPAVAAIKPNITMDRPPRTGPGIVAISAPNFGERPSKMATGAAITKTNVE